MKTFAEPIVARYTKLDDKKEILEQLKFFNKSVTNMAFGLSSIALIIVFFSLKISMKHNIRDAQQQFAILRSMGITQKDGCRIYMYEAFAIVITGCMLGTVFGSLIAYLIAL